MIIMHNGKVGSIATYRLGNTIENNFHVSMIMNDSELGVGIA